MYGFLSYGRNTYGGARPFTGVDYTKELLEDILLQDIVLNYPKKVLSDAFTLIDSILVETAASRILTETIILVDSFNTVINRIISDSLSMSDSVLKQGQKVLIDSYSMVDTTVRSTAKVILNSLTLVDTYSRTIVYGKTLVETVAMVDLIIKSQMRYLTESFSLSDSTVKEINRVLVGIWRRASKAANVTWKRRGRPS